MKDAALAAIGVYQRYVSPYKGFCCAYRVHTGRASCSALGARVIRRWGVLRGLAVLKLRLRRCGEVHRRCASRPRPLAAQRGSCDLDLPGVDADCCDAADVCDCCDCDWRRRDKVKPQRQRKADKAKRWNAQARRWDETADADAGRRRDG